MAEHPAETMRRAAMLLRSEPGTVTPAGLPEALERWLEHEADRADRRVSLAQQGWWCHNCGDYTTGRCECWDGALATARAILGEEDAAVVAAGGEGGLWRCRSQMRKP